MMVANMQERGRYSAERLIPLLKAQIDNSLELGWAPKRIWLLTNFPYYHRKVKGVQMPLPDKCLTGGKMFGIHWLLHERSVKETIWAHDLDVWQNEQFDEPDLADVGICRYSNSKLNGGSVFWKPQAVDLVDRVVQILADGEDREEPTLNKILKDKKLKDRVTIMNETYNVGCSGFVKRAERADKPILAAHFNPQNRIAWETHALDRNKIGIKTVSPRLEKLLRRYYPTLANSVTTLRAA
jgi:hypothetical protein